MFEGDWEWATATIRMRHVADFEDTSEPVLYEGVLRSPGGRLAIGDADSELTFNDLGDATRVRVHALNQSPAGATDVHIDLASQAS